MTDLRCWLCFIALCLGLVAPACAGNIHFGIARQDHKLVLTNQGNSTAYYPVVFRLQADGRWEPLPALPGRALPAELPAQKPLELQWPPEQAGSPFAASVPLMVRFFDQAGAAFGQLSFFNQPAASAWRVDAAYRQGALLITPPSPDTAKMIRASWLLWAQEEGIRPLTGTVAFEHVQPPAQRIEWQSVSEPLHFKLGAGQPSAMLLHDVAGALQLQGVASGGVQGREQRAVWLNSGLLFQRWAGIIVTVLVLLGIGRRLRIWRKETMA